MQILYTAIALGLMGSFHCVGMCGPIALSLPLRGNTVLQKMFGGILYNLGRTLTYGVMGAIFGLIGEGFRLVGYQQWISVAMGTLMILSILVPSIFKNINVAKAIPFTGFVRKNIQGLFTQRSYGALFVIGVLNGLLPCGLVYMAIAGAIGAGSLFYGIAFMVLFGLGTLPMMLFISMLGTMIGQTVRNKINKVIPFIVVMIGLIFILRGLSLGIPYLSPPKEKLTPHMHMQSDTTSTIQENVHKSCCHDE